MKYRNLSRVRFTSIKDSKRLDSRRKEKIEKPKIRYRKVVGKSKNTHNSEDTYLQIRANSDLNAKNRVELENYIKDGVRPVYGYPHMNFGGRE